MDNLISLTKKDNSTLYQSGAWELKLLGEGSLTTRQCHYLDVVYHTGIIFEVIHSKSKSQYIILEHMDILYFRYKSKTISVRGFDPYTIEYLENMEALKYQVPNGLIDTLNQWIEDNYEMEPVYHQYKLNNGRIYSALSKLNSLELDKINQQFGVISC